MGSGSSASTCSPSATASPPPASATAQRRGAHGEVVRADHHQVVMVVGHRARDRPPRQPDALHEAEPDVARAAVALDHGHLEEVALRVRHAPSRRGPATSRVRCSVMSWSGIAPITRAWRPRGADREVEPLGVEVDGPRQVLAPAVLARRASIRAVPRHQLAARRRPSSARGAARSEKTTRSARRPGATAPRSRSR